MRTLAFLCCAGMLLTLGLISPRPAAAQSLYRFSTTDANIPNTNDDGYDPANVTITADPNVTAPANGTALFAGSTTLNGGDFINQAPGRLFNSEWNGFSLTSGNGSTLEPTERDTGYFTWTVSAKPGYKLNLSSLTFDSARGGTARIRGYQIYAATNGAPINFSTGSLDLVADEAQTATRTTPRSANLALNGPAYQGIDSITFRYYPLTETTINSIELANVSVNGTAIAVPEPASLAVAGLGAAWCLSRRRRTP